MAKPMDPISSSSATDPSALYQATMARRSTDQQRLEGAEAVRLIESATPPAPRPLPSDATISIHA
jgi:hypothetical protein